MKPYFFIFDATKRATDSKSDGVLCRKTKLICVKEMFCARMESEDI